MKNWFVRLFRSVFCFYEGSDVTDVAELTTRNARWTQDCHGKQDFDIPVIQVSCRMYPPHYQALTHQGMWHCCVSLLQYVQATNHGEYVTLFSGDVYGKTESETKVGVEQMVAQQLRNLTLVTFNEFRPESESVERAIATARKYVNHA